LKFHILNGDGNSLMQYDFNPRKLLSRILTVFLNLRSGDETGSFVTAVAEDIRSYRPENFTEASRIAAEVGLPDIDAAGLARLEQLAENVMEAAERVQQDDEVRARVARCLQLLVLYTKVTASARQAHPSWRVVRETTIYYPLHGLWSINDRNGQLDKPCGIGGNGYAVNCMKSATEFAYNPLLEDQLGLIASFVGI
jgi:hypothetical protein